MILLLTITKELLEAALYQTGPRLVVKDYHVLLESITKLESRLKKSERITGILALIGEVSFTRHRQTIALMNAFGAVRSIPIAALTFTDTLPDEKTIASAVAKLSKTKPGKILIPAYRAEPTITLKK